MYYTACLAIYIVIFLLVCRALRAAPKGHWSLYKDALMAEAYKCLTKYDVKMRRQRTRLLPLWQRFLYWVWFSMHFVLWFGTLILLAAFLHAIQGVFVVPEIAYAHATGVGTVIAFGVGAFFLCFDLTYVFSTMTNRGMIKRADRLYQLGPFSAYPSSISKIICGLLLLAGLPFMMLSLPVCTFYTGNGIVFQGAFSREVVPYHQMEEAQVSVTQTNSRNLNLDYVIRYQKNGAPIERRIYGLNIQGPDIEKVDETFIRKGVTVHRILISPELAARIEDEKVAWWAKLAFKLCGAKEPSE